MKKCVYLCVVLTLCGCKSIHAQQRPQLFFEENLKTIEKFLGGEQIQGTKLMDSAIFLQQVTNIKSDMYQGFDEFYTPSEHNLKDWKKWYKKNKDKLYWDEEEQTVKVRQEIGAK
jgi:hypothetical protein